jgi:hypothetical protein
MATLKKKLYKEGQSGYTIHSFKDIYSCTKETWSSGEWKRYICTSGILDLWLGVGPQEDNTECCQDVR